MQPEKKEIEWMWQAFIQENDNPNIQEFVQMLSKEFSCSLQEAQQKASHLMLIE
jgi:predicted solute-binding protein